MRIDYTQIERLANELRDVVGDDEQTFLDTLDGETDFMDIIGGLVKEREEAKAFSEASKSLITEYTDRKRRLESKVSSINGVIGKLLDVSGQDKVAHPLATVSRTKGRQSVVIVDESEVPSQLTKTKVEPDKAAIKRQLEAGEIVPGAALVIGDAGVTIRVK